MILTTSYGYIFKRIHIMFHSNSSHSFIYITQRAIIPVLETNFQSIYYIMVK